VSDDIGTTGGLEFLYRGDDTHVFYVDGIYRGPLFNREIRGRGLLVLKSGYLREPDGRSYITSRLDAFMNIEPATVEFLTKTFQPAVGKVADGNFTQTANFVACLQKTAEVDRPGVERLARKLSKVRPELRQQLADISRRISEGKAVAASGPAPLPERVLRQPQTSDGTRIARRPTDEAPQ
jgi:hypothetical protein